MNRSKAGAEQSPGNHAVSEKTLLSFNLEF